MAVSRTGSITDIHTSNNTGSQSVSVPADAELMVVGLAGAIDSGSIFGTASISIGGAAASLILDAYGDGVWESALFYRVSPATGSQTFAWDFAGSGSVTYGAHILIAFYKGINTTTPIKANGGEASGDGSFTTGSLSATTGDMAVALCSKYGGFGDSTWSGVTEISTDFNNNCYYSWGEGTPSSNVTITATVTDGSNYGAVCGIVIAQAAGGGSVENISGAMGRPAGSLAKTVNLTRSISGAL